MSIPLRRSHGEHHPSIQREYYAGSSMGGTFRPGDVLGLTHTPPSTVSSGDVVVFRNPSCRKLVVHRVRHIEGNMLSTQGDASSRPDPFPVTRADVLAKVVSVQRHGWTTAVANGRRGRIHLFTLRALARIRFLVSPAWHRILENGLTRKLLKQLSPTTRIVIVETPTGPIHKFIWCHRVVATWTSHTDLWVCQTPFQYVLSKPEAL